MKMIILKLFFNIYFRLRCIYEYNTKKIIRANFYIFSESDWFIILAVILMIISLRDESICKTSLKLWKWFTMLFYFSSRLMRMNLNVKNETNRPTRYVNQFLKYKLKDIPVLMKLWETVIKKILKANLKRTTMWYRI